MMPKQCKKAATSDKSGCDEVIMVPLFVALNDTHTFNQKRNPRRAKRNSVVAALHPCTKNKSPLASPPVQRCQKKMPPQGIDIRTKGNACTRRSQCQGKVSSIPMMMTKLTTLTLILVMTSFGCPFQGTVLIKI
jgi:hypothetical protein